MTPLSRRDFMAQAAVTATAAVAVTTTMAQGATGRAGRDKSTLPKSPADLVTLGKTGIQVSLVGMGTGSIGSGQASNQTRLGVKEFTRVVRHALDHGVRFFDVADQYGSHVYLREALKGVPRDQYVIQTKTHATNVRRRQEPPRAVPPRAGCRLHRHRSLALHAENRLARREPGVDGIPDESQGRKDHPRPRHELPWHGSLARFGQKSVRRGRPGADQSRRA